MTASWHSLPNEIQCLIFEQLRPFEKNPKFYELLLVSKEWYSLIKPVFYSDVNLNQAPASVDYTEFLEKLIQGDNLHYVKQLVIIEHGCSDEMLLEHKYLLFSKILRLASNLKFLHIHIFHSEGPLWVHMASLLGARSVQGRLQSLEVLGIWETGVRVVGNYFTRVHADVVLGMIPRVRNLFVYITTGDGYLAKGLLTMAREGRTPTDTFILSIAAIYDHPKSVDFDGDFNSQLGSQKPYRLFKGRGGLFSTPEFEGIMQGLRRVKESMGNPQMVRYFAPHQIMSPNDPSCFGILWRAWSTRQDFLFIDMLDNEKLFTSPRKAFWCPEWYHQDMEYRGLASELRIRLPRKSKKTKPGAQSSPRREIETFFEDSILVDLLGP